jgi:hypothetical protein
MVAGRTRLDAARLRPPNVRAGLAATLSLRATPVESPRPEGGKDADELPAAVSAAAHACGLVSNSAGGPDYTGELGLGLGIRLTDRGSAATASGGTESATVQDLTIPATIPCAATLDLSTGGRCELNRTVNALQPGAVISRARDLAAGPGQGGRRRRGRRRLDARRLGAGRLRPVAARGGAQNRAPVLDLDATRPARADVATGRTPHQNERPARIGGRAFVLDPHQSPGGIPGLVR